MATVGIKSENEQTEDGALKRTSERASQRTWGTATQDSTKKHSFNVLYLNQAIFCTNRHSKVNRVFSGLQNQLYLCFNKLAHTNGGMDITSYSRYLG